MSHVSKWSILKLVDGLFTSKIWCALQLYGRVRLNATDTEEAIFKSIQLVQNKLLRFLNGTVSLLAKFDMLAVNQLNAQIKLLEMWKSKNVDTYNCIFDKTVW